MTDPDAPRAAADRGATTDDFEVMTGLELQGERRIPRKQVWSWALWDWATQPFNSVITTFVFSVYLTSALFLPSDVAGLDEGDRAYDRGLADLSSQLGLAIGIGGILIALLAPVLGQRADAEGRRKAWLAFATGGVILSMAMMFFVEADARFFWLGAGLLAAGTVFSEIAGVNYNAMLVQVSTPRTVGRVSGLGWGFGYLGGIVVLALVVVAQLSGWFGIPTEGGLNIRIVALFCAVWTLVFSLPIFLNVPEAPPAPGRERVGFFRSYVVLVRDIARLWREARPTFWFLLASAVYRDGLAGVFTFGALIASVTFGFSFNEVVIFGVAANIVAGVSTIFAGRLDDRFGPRAVILATLGGLVVSTLVVFFAHDAGTAVFWIFGLFLSALVGPAQAASRSFLARVTPAGREGEIFGLYATTGRAASFLSPLLWAGFISVAGAQYWGILGIALILAAGFVMMLFVRLPKRVADAADSPTPSAAGTPG
jgi:UMF1 family MFS transporter